MRSARDNTRRLVYSYLLVAITAVGSVVGLAWWVGRRIPDLEARRLANIQLRLLRRAKDQIETARNDMEYRAQVVAHQLEFRDLNRQLTPEMHEALTRSLYDVDLEMIQLRRYGANGDELWEWASPGQRVPRLTDAERADLLAWAQLRENAGTSRIDLQEWPPGQGRWIIRAVAPVWSSDVNMPEARGIVCLWTSNRNLFEQFLIHVHPFPESYTFVLYWRSGEDQPDALPVLQWHFAEPEWVGVQPGDATGFLKSLRDQVSVFRDEHEDSQLLDVMRRDGSRRHEILSFVPVVFGARRWLLFLSTPYHVATEFSAAQQAFIVLLGILAAGILLVGVGLLYYQRRRLASEASEQSRLQLMEMGLRYRELFAENPTAMLVIDNGGMLADCNYSAERLFGASRHEVVGRPLATLFETESAAPLWESLRRQGHLHARDTRLVRERDHASILVEVWGRRIGEQWIIMAQDVEQRRDLERQIARLKRMDSMGMLASTLAHDFNNVLGQVQMLVSHLRMDLGDNTDANGSLAAIEEKVTDAARLVGDLLALREDVVSTEAVALEPILREFVAHQQQVVPRTVHMTLTVRSPLPDAWITPHALRRILGNLCVNACDAMQYGGELGVKAYAKHIEPRDATPELRSDEYAVIEVADGGSGMSETVLDELFQPFFTTKAAGTGLGLWTVYKIVRRVGGMIHVHSRVGKGTRFTIYLPHSRPGTRIVTDAK